MGGILVSNKINNHTMQMPVYIISLDSHMEKLVVPKTFTEWLEAEFKNLFGLGKFYERYIHAGKK